MSAWTSGDCDEDGVLNGEDEFPTDDSRSCTVTAENSAPGTTADCDNDSHANDADNCPAIANTDQNDTDRNGQGNACDLDDDGDGIPDTMDEDDDNDGVLDDEDEFPTDDSRSCTVTPENSGSGTTADCDNDGNANDADNCPADANSDQTNNDLDNAGDACDVDDDNDGLIEIATSEELNNVRHNLMGTSYDDEEADTSPGDAGDTTGAPTSEPTACEDGDSGTTRTLCGYELSTDIDLTSIANWQPIGASDSAPFRANFDGNGFLVSNMAIDTGSGERIGLFGSVGMSGDTITIRNLRVQGSIVYRGTANVRIGGLISIFNTTDGLIDGCSSAVAIIGGSGTNQFIGGLIGDSVAEVQNSWATGNVHSCDDDDPTIDGCAPDGCTCEGGGIIGGLIGLISSSISNSYATGSSRGIGGLIGVNTTPLENSYATGAVVGGNGADSIGGLVGTALGNISRSYATGTVNDGDDDTLTATADNIGGLIGETSIGVISDNYYSGAVGTITGGGVSTTGDRAGTGGSAAVIPQSTPADLQRPISVGGIYSAWSASDWDFGSVSQFPALKSTDGDLLCGQPAPRVQCSS